MLEIDPLLFLCLAALGTHESWEAFSYLFGFSKETAEVAKVNFQSIFS